ncbi:geranylgeranyl transferase type-2 subunit alpha 2 [Arabidopsis lyrata subsp. lyrata]|uniref:geranylgeranyl transferase type-2 subunit alpha 2 n=1 Tax=Arabidopsis lyrata subsp. lyrata TaxID=81972 RepID=UPI000A29B341|nr:geranylgeranyl transferase type-2 subunit alpha 2 [Arabidopsis lyrata subsp. lyrata]|eukprot:XP_020886577.1 geranylgeranyl transferase type-2 subunit alpha 2 [Arabidopsis lyrata subsp. lyrata]
MDPSSRHSAKEVGDGFAERYYKTLQYYPGLLYRYYNDVSKITRPGLDGTMRSSTLQDMIKDLDMLSSGGFDSVEDLEVTSFMSQESHSGGILVTADGFFTSHERPARKFTQNFFLAPQENDYFALTDMFKFVDIPEANDIKDLSVIPAVPKSTTTNTEKDEVIDRLVALKVETRLIEAVQAVKTSFDQIPPDNTSDIFFRIPKRYYPIVACVSKAFKNLVKSPELQQQRRQLDKDSVYFCFNNGSPNPAESMTWFSLRKSNDNPNDDVFSEALVVPNDHECTRTLRNIFSCGSEIILVGRTFKLTIGPECQVWIFDSICGRLREAPSLPLALHYWNSGLVRDDLYVFGTPLKADTLRERFQVYGIRFNLLSQTWSDPFPTKMQFSASTQSVDKNIYLLTREGLYQVYNISNDVFTSYREPYKSHTAWTTWTMSSVCVFENVFYSYDAVYGLHWYDTKLNQWKAVTGSTMGRIGHGLLGKTWSIALKEYYGKLVLLWTVRPEEIAEDARMTVYYTMIALRRTETEIYGEVDEIRTLDHDAEKIGDYPVTVRCTRIALERNGTEIYGEVSEIRKECTVVRRPRNAASKPEASAAKAFKLRSIQSQFMSNHHRKIYTQEAIQLSAKLLAINPEAYTAWNYRKLAVEDNLSRIDDSDPSLVNSILNEELEVVAIALRRNIKSYGAWYHRKWILNKYQKLDLRNFHAWNYRRFVVELTKTSPQDELQYTTDLINDVSFSNYSAWHNRSALLSSLVAKKADGFMPKETIRRELDYVHNAIFTDEDDQSAWFYYLWLLDQTVKMETPLRTSSWPSDGSIIILSGPGCFNGSSSSKFTTFCSESASFPLILYFDQAVSGVSSSTVTIDSELQGNQDLVWEPVSDKNSQLSCVWVARLKFDSTEPCFRKENKVKVSLGKSQGIVSSRGCNLSAPFEFVFTVHIHDTVGEPQEGIVSWTDGFDNWDAQSKDLNSLITSYQLNADTGFEWRKQAIKTEIECFRDLHDSKFGKLILARLLMAEETMISDDAVKGVHYVEILQLYNDLMVLNSSHYQYYKDEHSVALLHKVTSSTESLSRHLFLYRNMNNIVCLRLSNLTLSRIATVEKFLFVQMLDLSYNDLHSAEGLEAMQLLCCLNLCHNRIRSFSALDSLRHLKQLRVLDVSHNDMGGKHPVDTTGYLCSRPLSNSAEIGRQVPCKYWDAYLVLRDLKKLKQLDIIRGNDLIAGEEFSSFVRQVLPKLVWLDGHKLAS